MPEGRIASREVREQARRHREAMERERARAHVLVRRLAIATGALRDIEERPWLENALNPQWPAACAKDALERIEEVQGG